MNSIETDAEKPALVRGATCWKGWVILWVGLVVVELVLLLGNGALDTWLWCATRWLVGDREFYSWASYSAGHVGDVGGAFYTHVAPPLHSSMYKHMANFWEVMKSFGEPWMTVVIVGVVAVHGRWKWWSGAMVGAGAICAGGLGGLVRIVAGRTRPTHIDGGNVWEFLRGFHNGTDLSWPSGHATVAFATAAVLTYLSPKGRCVFVAVATGCALSRVVMGAHFYSDAVFGGVLGWTVGWWVAVGMAGLARRGGEVETKVGSL